MFLQDKDIFLLFIFLLLKIYYNRKFIARYFIFHTLQCIFLLFSVLILNLSKIYLTDSSRLI